MRPFLSFRHVLLNLALLLIAVVVTLGLLELFVRVTGLQPFETVPKIYRVSKVPGLVYELLPSIKERGFSKETITTNALGLRSPEIDSEKPMIAVLGDSMAFGFGMEDGQTNPALLQNRFPSMQVVNMGVSGYNLEQEVLAYEHLAKEWNPALVILEFVTNDAQPKAHYNAQGVLTTQDLTPQEERARLEKNITKPGMWRIPGKVFLEQRSALFRLIERRTKGMWFRARTSHLGKEWPAQELAEYQRWFAKLDESVGDRPKLLVRWPDNWLYPNTMLDIDQMATARGWKILDLGDLFGTRFPTLGWDQHPNVATQAKAAEVIADFIERERLLP